MSKGSTLILRGAVLLIGLVVLGLCLFAVPAGIRSDNTSPGGYEPILWGLYIPAIPFFIAIYQALKLLNYIDNNQTFSNLAVLALRNIKYCAAVITALFTAGMPYIYHVADKDDAPGVIAIALTIIFASFVIGTFAAVLQKLLQNAIDIKSENDLTV